MKFARKLQFGVLFLFLFYFLIILAPTDELVAFFLLEYRMSFVYAIVLVIELARNVQAIKIIVVNWIF